MALCLIGANGDWQDHAFAPYRERILPDVVPVSDPEALRDPRSTRFALAHMRISPSSLVAAVLIVGSHLDIAPAEEAQAIPQVSDLVEQAAGSEAFDPEIVEAVRKVPAKVRVPLALKLMGAANHLMRREAALMLSSCPVRDVGDGFRKLLHDEDVANRNLAASYLAKNTDDREARAVLLTNATHEDPAIATAAVTELGWLRGEDVENVLLQVLQSTETPKAVRIAAIVAAGNAEAKRCTSALAALLEDKERRTDNPRDTARVCDLAASALERIHGINCTGIKDVYFTGPLVKRDEGFAFWKKWAGPQGGEVLVDLRERYIGELLEESSRALLGPADGKQRPRIKARLSGVLGCSFCLGDFPGVDAVVLPSVRDLWKILRVAETTHWERSLNPWQELERAYEESFRPKVAAPPPAQEQVAADFIAFAKEVTDFPRVWVWSFCRDFVERFPGSDGRAGVERLRAELEGEFRKQQKRIVLHGHTPVLEPRVKEKTSVRSDFVLDYGAQLGDRVREEPSNWSCHRLIIDHCIRKNIDFYESYPFLTEQAKLYPGNEWPFLADAAYQLRHKHRPEVGVRSADKSLILNPQNPKAYAIRGMVRLALEDKKEEALRDLLDAFDLDHTSLGDEPETPQAVAFLIKKVLDTNPDQAHVYVEKLGELKAFGAKQPLKETDEFRKLAERAAAGKR